MHVTDKLLVMTGEPMKDAMYSEVVAIGDEHSSCKIPYSNTFDWFDGTGALVGDEILVCPGWNGKDSIYKHCWILSKQNTRLITLIHGRINAAAIVMGKDWKRIGEKQLVRN